MPYLNQIDINGVIYNLENLTDGLYIAKLPELKGDDVLIVRGNVIDSVSSSARSLPLSANQGRILNNSVVSLTTRTGALEEKTAQLRTDVDEHTSNKNNPHEITPAQLGTYNKDEIDMLFGANGSDALKQTLKFKELTSDEYNALDKKEENTLYMLTDSYDPAAGIPPYNSADEGKVLKIVNGTPTWVIP